MGAVIIGVMVVGFGGVVAWQVKKAWDESHVPVVDGNGNVLPQ
jgi:hypothetical protein